MNNKFLGESSPGLLRKLADQIDSGDYPDFIVIVKNGDEFISAHDCQDDPFSLLGAIEFRKSLIVEHIER